MKQITGFFLLCISPNLFAQTEAEIITNANNLIFEKKYESAFNLLEKYDPTNDKVDILLLKKKIVLNYAVTSIMHQMFSLKDIKKNEDILDYKGKTGIANTYAFQADSLITRLIKKHPNNCQLQKGLADYYYEITLKYPNKWLKSDNELYDIIKENYQKAAQANCGDYTTYYALGIVHLLEEKYETAITYLIKSIEFNDKYSNSHYNLAYAYHALNQQENALIHAQNSLNLYKDKESKSDVARMIGQIYTDCEDDKNAIKYYEMAKDFDPKNYYNFSGLVYLYLKTENKKAEKTTKDAFNLDPTNPSIYTDLENIYSKFNKNAVLINFYKSQLSEFKNDKVVIGNVNFALARMNFQTDKNTAQNYLIKAKQAFEQVFEKDHAVFNVIEEGLKECKQ